MCRLSGWRCKFSAVGRAQVWPSPPSSRSWWCAGSWLTTSASTTRNMTVWRVSWDLFKLHPVHSVVRSISLVIYIFGKIQLLKFFMFWLFVFVFFYVSGAYEWAQKTLKDHAKDKRPYIYTREQLEKAKTHDELWNAAQVQRLGWILCKAVVSKSGAFTPLKNGSFGDMWTQRSHLEAGRDLQERVVSNPLQCFVCGVKTSKATTGF